VICPADFVNAGAMLRGIKVRVENSASTSDQPQPVDGASPSERLAVAQ
jgi:hypothetical protein